MSETKTPVRSKIKPKLDLEPPSYYNVIYINDDVTTVDFVIESLCTVFAYETDAAQNITTRIHEDGSAVVATYPYEMAEQKGIEATLMARNKGFPLQIKIEQE